jgi:serine/threonine protein kinase
MTDGSERNDRTQSHIVLVKGTMVSNYRIIAKIGVGGMGEVYLAEDTALTHPNIIMIYEWASITAGRILPSVKGNGLSEKAV